ncbi:MAG: cupredoxin domain-containing protein [Acidimicrobiales bacterium]|nr:cupredoxin domain-containing protein [Acidimicrobiales bacterium]
MPSHSTPRRLLGLAATTLLVAGLGLTACGSGGDDVELVEGVTENVDALDNSFAPEEITVQAGTEIVFTNRGRNDHNVIPADPDEDWTIEVDDFKPGTEAAPIAFDEPGTYDYFCSIHGTATAGMIGSITVEG